MANHRAETQKGLRLWGYLHRSQHRLRPDKGLPVDDLCLAVALEHTDQAFRQLDDGLRGAERALNRLDASILDGMGS